MAGSEKGKFDFEDHVLDALKKGGLERDNLRDLVKAVSGLRREKLKAIRVFPKGIPYPDRIEVAGILETTSLAPFLQDILTFQHLGEIRVFPLGIPYPDWIQVNFEVR
jgi:hypothetical protein